MTGGGSGGHITPLLPLAHELKKRSPDCRIIYIGLKGERISGLESRYGAFDAVYRITSGKFRRYHGQSLISRVTDFKTIWLNLRDLFEVVRGTMAARRLMRRLKPDVVFSKGGFVVVPVGLAARSRHIPIITHDSDAVPGLANRFIGKWASIHATGMPPEYYPYDPKTISYTGIPVDERIKKVSPQMQADYKKQLNIEPSYTVLLVGGAGHGARDLNHHVTNIADELFSKVSKLHILHLSGDQHLSDVIEAYKSKLNTEQFKNITVVGFTPEFYKYSGAADLVVTRAGATTIAELALQRKAVLLIPAPFLTGGHQLQNAKALTDASAARLVDNDASDNELLSTITDLLTNDHERSKLADNLNKTAHPNAAADLAEIIINTAEHKI